jgi:hypothetical protein
MSWIAIAQRGFEKWKAQDHNKRWFRLIDGTPIPNDLVINIGEEFMHSIRLTSAEISSGHSRVAWAEGLILQLPNTYDSRNSWLLNYGTGLEAMQIRAKRGIKWDDETQSAELPI